MELPIEAKADTSMKRQRANSRGNWGFGGRLLRVLLTVDIQILYALSLSPLIADSIADFLGNQVRWVFVVGRLLEPKVCVGSRSPFDDQDV